VLRSTCSGIQRAEIYAKSVTIRVSKWERHLELEYDDGDESDEAKSEKEIDCGEK
jgi:hypothetical protein